MLINWIAKRFKTVRVEISPRITEALNSNFDSKFSNELGSRNSNGENVISATTTTTTNTQRSFIQPGRTYREELYSSRRIELTPTQATPTAFRKLSQRLQEEQVLQRVKERRYFVRPGLVKHAIIYAGRRKKFNQLVRDTINRIVEYKESQK